MSKNLLTLALGLALGSMSFGQHLGFAQPSIDSPGDSGVSSRIELESDTLTAAEKVIKDVYARFSEYQMVPGGLKMSRVVFTWGKGSEIGKTSPGIILISNELNYNKENTVNRKQLLLVLFHELAHQMQFQFYKDIFAWSRRNENVEALEIQADYIAGFLLSSWEQIKKKNVSQTDAVVIAWRYERASPYSATSYISLFGDDVHGDADSRIRAFTEGWEVAPQCHQYSSPDSLFPGFVSCCGVNELLKMGQKLAKNDIVWPEMKPY